LFRGLLDLPAGGQVGDRPQRKEIGPGVSSAIQVAGAADEPAKRNLPIGSGQGGHWARESLVVADVPHAVGVPETNLTDTLFATDRDVVIIGGLVHTDSYGTQGGNQRG
jgi:hypothetical protein